MSQDTEKAMERVAKARESSELWREVRELRRDPAKQKDRSNDDSPEVFVYPFFPLGSEMISCGTRGVYIGS